jgi:hypothetical protein
LQKHQIPDGLVVSNFRKKANKKAAKFLLSGFT